MHRAPTSASPAQLAPSALPKEQSLEPFASLVPLASLPPRVPIAASPVPQVPSSQSARKPLKLSSTPMVSASSVKMKYVKKLQLSSSVANVTPVPSARRRTLSSATSVLPIPSQRQGRVSARIAHLDKVTRTLTASANLVISSVSMTATSAFVRAAPKASGETKRSEALNVLLVPLVLAAISDCARSASRERTPSSLVPLSALRITPRVPPTSSAILEARVNAVQSRSVTTRERTGVTIAERIR